MRTKRKKIDNKVERDVLDLRIDFIFGLIFQIKLLDF